MPTLPTLLLIGLCATFILAAWYVIWLLTHKQSHQKGQQGSWQQSPVMGPLAHQYPGTQVVLNADTQEIEAQYKARMEAVISDFEKQLIETQKMLQNTLLQNMNQVQKTHGQFLTNLEEMANTEQKNTTQRVDTKVNELLLNFEQNLTGFLSSSEQKSLEAINLEVRSARQLIDGYKAQQLAIIDENIVSVLERTLEIVLKEKLTLKNQVDLVFDALQRAKVEKFFV